MFTPLASRFAVMTASRHMLKIAFAVALVVCAGSSRGVDKDAKDSEHKDVFAKDFRPIIKEYCYRCHGESTRKADLNLA